MKQNERIMVIVAAVIAVVAVVAFVMMRSGGQSVPPTGTGTDQSQGQGQNGAPPGMGKNTTSQPSGKLIPVPAGMTPSEYLTKTYTLVKAKKYQDAFKMYPESVQQGGFESFKSSREGMPVINFKVGSMTTKGNTATIAVQQTLGGQAAGSPNWVVTWQFKKDKKGNWGVESYQVNMGQ